MTKQKNGGIFRARCAVSEVTFYAWRYDPNFRDMPQGFKARTSSQGPQAILPRSDGIHWTMAPFDVALKVDGGDWIALPAQAFDELFEAVPTRGEAK